MSSYLAPIVKPKGFMLKMGYWYTRRRFGMVPGPLAVFCARMPTSFTSFYGKVGKLDKELVLSLETAMLVRERVASTNACGYCMDANRWAALNKASVAAAKLDELESYETSARYSEKERAALAYASELTEHKHANPETFDRLARHYSEREICDIVWVVSSEHLYNINNIGLNIGSASMCELNPAASEESRADCRC